jgi:hypothetical protein
VDYKEETQLIKDLGESLREREIWKLEKQIQRFGREKKWRRNLQRKP